MMPPKTRFRMSRTVSDPLAPTTGQGMDEQTGMPLSNQDAAVQALFRPMPGAGTFNPGWGGEGGGGQSGDLRGMPSGAQTGLHGDEAVMVRESGLQPPADGRVLDRGEGLRPADGRVMELGPGLQSAGDRVQSLSGAGQTAPPGTSQSAWDREVNKPGPGSGKNPAPHANGLVPTRGSGYGYGTMPMMPMQTNASASLPNMSGLLQGSPYDRIMQALGGAGAGERTNIDALIAELNSGYRL